MKHKHHGKHITDHDHPHHRGPHHDMYIHEENQVKQQHSRGEHAMGDKSHLKSVMGEPHGADVAGHHGKMHW